MQTIVPASAIVVSCESVSTGKSSHKRKSTTGKDASPVLSSLQPVLVAVAAASVVLAV
jgi:hypothetical protein